MLRLFVLTTLMLLFACAPQGAFAPTVVPSPTTAISTPTKISIPTILPASPTAITVPSTTGPLVALPGSDVELAARFDNFFSRLGKRLFSGVVLVAHQGTVLYQGGFGTTKQKPFVPITPSAKFRIASVTKQFTAAAILKLQSQGKLKVDETVCKYLDPCPKDWDKVTLHHLLTHSSGMPIIYILDSHEPHGAAELAARVGKLPLQFDPGARYSYSNEGYLVLAAVIEELSGKTYEAFLRESFLDPLEMNDTGIAIDDTQLTGFSSKIDFTNLAGSAALYSTVADLYRWSQALTAWQENPSSEYQAMFQPHVAEDVPEVHYGYGLEMVQLNGHPYVGHPGGTEGYGSHVARFPDSELTVIVLSNNSFAIDPDILATVAFGNK